MPFDIPADPESMYNRGWDDGVEWVIDWINDYISTGMVNGMEPEWIKACEDLLEDLQNTIDEQ